MTPAELVALAEADPLASDAVHEAARHIDDDDPEVRWAALDALGRMTAFRGAAIDERTAARIAARTTDSHPRVRAEAASVLAMLPVTPPGAAAAVRPLLADPDPRVRVEACAALGDLGDPASRDALAELLGDDEAAISFEAAFALASLGDGRGRLRLEAALTSSRHRLDACEALRRLGDRSAVPALEKLAGKLFLPWLDRVSAQAALYVLGQPTGEAITARATSRNLQERAHALALAGSLRLPGARALLEAVARDPKDRLRDTAVRALGDLGDPEALPLLAEIEAGPDRTLAADAAESIIKLRA